MYFRDHPPPHFHAHYGEHVAEIAIDTLAPIDDWLPRALRLVLEWTGEHQDTSRAPTGTAPGLTTRWSGSTRCRRILRRGRRYRR
jgi:Domain of unknown function (DUF4160)